MRRAPVMGLPVGSSVVSVAARVQTTAEAFEDMRRRRPKEPGCRFWLVDEDEPIRLGGLVTRQ